MNQYRMYKITECLLKVLNNCFCSMICFSRITQTRIAICPLLTYGSHLMLSVLFHQWLFFFYFFSNNYTCWLNMLHLITYIEWKTLEHKLKKTSILQWIMNFTLLRLNLQTSYILYFIS